MKCWAWAAVVSWEIKVLNHSPHHLRAQRGVFACLSQPPHCCSPPRINSIIPRCTFAFPTLSPQVELHKCLGSSFGEDLGVTHAGCRCCPALQQLCKGTALHPLHQQQQAGGSQCPPWNAHLEHILSPLIPQSSRRGCVCISGGCNIAGSGFHLRIPRDSPAPSVNTCGKHQAHPVETALSSFLRLRICASRSKLSLVWKCAGASELQSRS